MAVGQGVHTINVGFRQGLRPGANRLPKGVVKRFVRFWGSGTKTLIEPIRAEVGLYPALISAYSTGLRSGINSSQKSVSSLSGKATGHDMEPGWLNSC